MARHTDKLVLILILLLTLPLAILSADYPQPEGFVNDFAGVITSEHRSEIEALARSLSENGQIELAVVTVPSLNGMDIASYSIGLAEAWKAGRAGEDTGIILLLAPNEREVRIEVGYGLEGDLPDGLTGEILDRYVVEQLRQNNFSAGMLEGSRAIAATLADRRGFELQQVRKSAYAAEQQEGESNYLYFLLLLLLIFGRGRMWPLLFLMGRRGRRYPRGGGFGASPRGGSFGGFGGGGFGGGGASRSF